MNAKGACRLRVLSSLIIRWRIVFARIIEDVFSIQFFTNQMKKSFRQLRPFSAAVLRMKLRPQAFWSNMKHLTAPFTRWQERYRKVYIYLYFPSNFRQNANPIVLLCYCHQVWVTAKNYFINAQQMPCILIIYVVTDIIFSFPLLFSALSSALLVLVLSSFLSLSMSTSPSNLHVQHSARASGAIVWSVLV